MMWSTHSRRIDPISRSAKPFCQGEAGAVGLSRMNLQFWPGAVAMTLIAAITASLVTNGGRSAWFLGALIVTVCIIFGTTLYLLPPWT
jgi:Ca2+/H+ antiporter